MLKPVLLIAALGLAAGTTTTGMARVEIDTQITIAAPISAVWSALTDVDRYPDWNPYHVRIDGTLQDQATLTVHIRKPNGASLKVKPHVMEITPERSLVWGGGIRGLFYGIHRFDLNALGPNCTHLSHTEIFSGLFVRAAALDAIEPGYQSMNNALKTRLEQDRDSQRS